MKLSLLVESLQTATAREKRNLVAHESVTFIEYHLMNVV